MAGFANQLDLVKQYLDLRIANHTLRSSNIANSETPNYRAQEASFKTTLDQISASKNSVFQSNPASFDVQGPRIKLEMRVQESGTPSRADGNNVNMDREMSALAENSMKYLSAIKILSREMAIQRYAITSGGR